MPLKILLQFKISTFADDDYISNNSANNGDDSVFIAGNYAAVVQYMNGDGNDTVQSNYDIIVRVDSNSVLLSNT